MTTDAPETVAVTFTRDDSCPICGAVLTVTYEATDAGVRAVDIPTEVSDHARQHVVDAIAAAQAETLEAGEPQVPADPVVAQNLTERIAELEAKLATYAAAKADLDAIIEALGGL
ncbi:hypothetical protein [uncultured Friedmanniella sp.]|uniref:hypothetical protein n=1 Tax=uncultured Friedmanniella sp. TaxID=335381 RepID=UPI0035CB020C